MNQKIYTESDKPFFEKSYDRNIRHICYKLLSDVRFNGEPIVPKILSEGENEIIGNHFEVERLTGVDLRDYIHDKNKSKSKKLKILLHIIRQLKAVDAAGFIIFDRHSENIRVLNPDSDDISTRQIDIEDMYDKIGNCVYTLDRASMDDELADLMKESGVSLWTPTVDKLAIIGEIIGEVHKDQAIVDIFKGCEWTPGGKGIL